MKGKFILIFCLQILVAVGAYSQEISYALVNIHNYQQKTDSLLGDIKAEKVFGGVLLSSASLIASDGKRVFGWENIPQFLRQNPGKAGQFLIKAFAEGPSSGDRFYRPGKCLWWGEKQVMTNMFQNYKAIKGIGITNSAVGFNTRLHALVLPIRSGVPLGSIVLSYSGMESRIWEELSKKELNVGFVKVAKSVNEIPFPYTWDLTDTYEQLERPLVVIDSDVTSSGSTWEKVRAFVRYSSLDPSSDHVVVRMEIIRDGKEHLYSPNLACDYRTESFCSHFREKIINKNGYKIFFKKDAGVLGDSILKKSLLEGRGDETHYWVVLNQDGRKFYFDTKPETDPLEKALMSPPFSGDRVYYRTTGGVQVDWWSFNAKDSSQVFSSIDFMQEWGFTEGYYGYHDNRIAFGLSSDEYSFHMQRAVRFIKKGELTIPPGSGWHYPSLFMYHNYNLFKINDDYKPTWNLSITTTAYSASGKQRALMVWLEYTDESGLKRTGMKDIYPWYGLIISSDLRTDYRLLKENIPRN